MASWSCMPAHSGAPKMPGLGESGWWRRLGWSQPGAIAEDAAGAPVHLGWREDDPALAMVRLPGLSPQRRQVVALGMSHHTGCSLLHARTFGVLVVFWPHGQSIVDALGSGQRSPLPLPSPACLSGCSIPHEQGAQGFSQDALQLSSAGTTRLSEQLPETLSKAGD